MKHTLRLVAVAGALVGAAACSSDQLLLPNGNQPTVTAIENDPNGLRLLATGIQRQLRDQAADYINVLGKLGRENYDYTPTEGRNTTGFLGTRTLDRAGFASGAFFGRYFNIRNVRTFLQLVDRNAVLTAEEKSAANGFGKTIEGLELYYVIATRDTLGAVVQQSDEPTDAFPFVSRDSVYRFIVAKLNDAAANLSAGGTEFPFDLTSGFTGFTTPATFLQFNRAIAARVLVTHASIGCGMSCYQAALTALSGSFIDENAAAFGPTADKGVFNVFSTGSGDTQNAASLTVSQFRVAQPSVRTDAPVRADGTRDLRFQSKVRTRATQLCPVPASIGICTDQTFAGLYPTGGSSIAIIRNEELVLLRAEARWFTGNKAGAIEDINRIRVRSGGLAVTTLTTGSSDDAFITELLLQRRFSLLYEGFRLVDVRRFNRVNTLPLDLPTQFRNSVLPVPQAECLFRVNLPVALRAPGC